MGVKPMASILCIWTIYDSPLDAPGQFVMRRFEVIDGGYRPTTEAHVSSNIRELRLLMQRRGLYRIPRQVEDEPHIVESWL